MTYNVLAKTYRAAIAAAKAAGIGRALAGDKNSVCPHCHEPRAEDCERTWQQWQCATCGSWNG